MLRNASSYQKIGTHVPLVANKGQNHQEKQSAKVTAILIQKNI